MAGGRPQQLAQCGRRFARCGRKVSEEGCWCFLRVGGGEGREGGLGLTSTKAGPDTGKVECSAPPHLGSKEKQQKKFLGHQW